MMRKEGLGEHTLCNSAVGGPSQGVFVVRFCTRRFVMFVARKFFGTGLVLACVVLAGGIAGQNAWASTILYSDTFDRGTAGSPIALGGSAPDVANGGYGAK